MTLIVRPAELADVAAICAIGQAAWPSTYAFAGQEYVDHGLATWWSPEAVTRSLATTTRWSPSATAAWPAWATSTSAPRCP